MSTSQRMIWQRPLLGREAACRARAVRAHRHARGLGVTQRQVAAMVGRSPRTLRHWGQKEREGVSLAKPRGRTVSRSSLAKRQALLASVRDHGPRCGIAVYQALHRTMPRAEVHSMIHRCRKVWRRRNPEIAYRLQWTRPGSVWAADHSHVRGATKEAKIAISCRDLGSHEQLLWETSRETG